jgi:hypothetical protein
VAAAVVSETGKPEPGLVIVRMTGAGAMHGLESFYQLIDGFPVAVILRNPDAMAAVNPESAETS